MGLYPYRNGMVVNLLKSDTLIGKNMSSLVEILGMADGKLIRQNGKLKIVYSVETKYNGIEPIFFSDLVIYFDTDTIVKQVEITEYNK